MLAYADGDMGAFQTLYHRHKSRIFGFLLAKLKDQAEAEEVFQTVFEKLHFAKNRYRQEIPFLPWIFTIARNAVIDHIRKRDTYRKHITTSEVDVEFYAEPYSDDCATGIDVEELSSLTESQRQALDLRFNQGMTFQEISAQMETSADNARQIISRAIRKLRKLMAGKEIYRERN